MSPLAVSVSDKPAQQHLQSENTLAVVEFNTQRPEPQDPRIVTTPLAPHASPLREVWTTGHAVRHGKSGAISWSQSDEVLVAHITLSDDGSDMTALAESAYRTMLAWLADQPGFVLWRCWNIFAGMNDGEGDRERYRQFSVGRFTALEHANMADCALFPAATAIGSQNGPLFLMILAGRKPAQLFENPRQVSAWHYPRKYGPRSPSFARAAQTPDGLILVSGTASVVGHETLHQGNWEAQLQETLINLDALITPIKPNSQARALRLYVRPGQPAQDIQDALSGALAQRGLNTPVITLQGDICRRDLLLEIEGVWS